MTLASILGAGVLIDAMVVNDSPTLEQMLSSEQLASVRQQRKLFGTNAEPMLVALTSEAEIDPGQVEHLVKELASVPGVGGALPLAAGVLGDGGGFKASNPSLKATRLILLWMRADVLGLEAARFLQRDIDRVIQRSLVPGQRTAVVGLPRLRSASWDIVQADARYLLPLLFAISVAVVAGCFLSWTALGLSLAITSSTTFVCLALQFLSGVQVNALLVSLVPVIWAIATLDVFHLYVAVARESRRRTRSPTRSGARQVFFPCLLTTVTTAGCFLTMTLAGASPLVASFGLWAAIGTVIAFLLTFSVGAWLLAHGDRDTNRNIPRWPARFCFALVGTGEKRPRAVLALWCVVAMASLLLLPQVQPGSDYPQVFARDQAVSQEIERLREITGSDLNPVEVILRPRDDAAGSAEGLFSAVLFTVNYLRTIEETKAVLPFALLQERDLRELRSSFEHSAGSSRNAPAWMAQWLGDGVVRVHWYLAPTDFERKSELFAWVSNFSRDALSGYAITLSGPGYHTHRIEVLGLANLAVGFSASLAIICVAFLLAVGRVPEAIAGALGTLLPLLAVAGGMALLDIPWSVALLPVPAMVLGLANDDAIHMVWRRRRHNPRRWRRNALAAGHALLATSVILSLATATMVISGIETNRFIGILTPLGLILALLCNLTLLPAISSWRRR